MNNKGNDMRIDVHVPSQTMLVVSLVFALLAVISVAVVIPYLSSWAFWLAIVAYVVLALSTLLKSQ
jgi:hypothetical protein